jgi:hypothetical protein
MSTERQLRNLLDLPMVDGRRIVPVTPPAESLLQPDWDSCVAAMLENHPDVLRVKAAAGADEARVRDVVHRTIHSLARSFLEIDTGYKQFKTASRLRTAAAERLEAQRAFYDEGRITIDRYLDAVSQYTAAVAQEARFRTGYNAAIPALEEAKGTLLAYDKITVVGDPKASARAVARREDGAKPAPAGPPAAAPAASPARLDAAVSPAKGEGSGAEPAGRTFSFQFTVGGGPRPVEVRGSFTITPARSADAPKAR